MMHNEEPEERTHPDDVHKGNLTRSDPERAQANKPLSPEVVAIRPPANLYRQHNAVVHHGHWGSITAEPAMLDVPANRYIVLTNIGPDALYVSDEEGKPAVHAVPAPAEGEEPGTYTVRGRVFLRSAGDSNLWVKEFYKSEPARKAA